MNSELKLATPQHRLASIAVDAGLYIVTLGIGWYIWNIIMWGQGQTPGKQLLKIRVYNAKTGVRANWGRMFIRQVLIGWILALPFYVPYFIFIIGNGKYEFNVVSIIGALLIVILSLGFAVIDVVWIFGPSGRRLLDYLAGTIIINEAVKPAGIIPPPWVQQ